MNSGLLPSKSLEVFDTGSGILNTCPIIGVPDRDPPALAQNDIFRSSPFWKQKGTLSKVGFYNFLSVPLTYFYIYLQLGLVIAVYYNRHD